MTTFSAIRLAGKDAGKFLQGQLTINVAKLTSTPQACAIANLKGRVQFGLWVNCIDNVYTIIGATDCMADLQAHIKKYGAFSKLDIAVPTPVYPVLINGEPSFASDQTQADFVAWAMASIERGNYWITQATQELFQPQELRLHQRGGVDYDKGCYLGQEIIARLYFKASPKAYLHRVRFVSDEMVQAGDKLGKVQVVNALQTPNGITGLVVGTPSDVALVAEVLPLPEALQQSVARQS